MIEASGSKEKAKRELTFPDNHEAGMCVPTGGSMCKNCEYLNADEETCSNEFFIAWNGNSNVIPGPIDGYCSDFYEPNDEAKEEIESRDGEKD